MDKRTNKKKKKVYRLLSIFISVLGRNREINQSKMGNSASPHSPFFLMTDGWSTTKLQKKHSFLLVVVVV